MSSRYDFVIVGGGVAGLVVAARLSEIPDIEVLVLEAGEDQTADPRVSIPALGLSLVNSPSDWRFRTVPQDGLDGRENAIPQGRLLGGSGALNGLSFTITTRSNIGAWASLGNPGWDWSSFNDASKKAYSITSGEGEGPLKLSLPDNAESFWPKTWQDTIRGLGFPSACDPLSGEGVGSSLTPDTVDPETRQRSYAASAYLQSAKSRTNLTVITGALVEKIVFRTDAGEIVAEAVRYNKDGETKTVKAQKEVVLTAGTFNSARLLELSGVGDAELLHRLGIDVVLDNPHVGENLQNHLMVGASFEVLPELDTMDSIVRQEPAAVGAAMEAYGKGSGPFTRSGTSATAQLPLPATDDISQLLDKLSPPKTTATPAFTKAHETYVRSVLASSSEPSAYYLSFPGFALFSKDGAMAPPPAGDEKFFTIGALLAHPLSRGSSHITSESLDSAALAINPAYLSHPLDVEVLARHVQQIEKIAASEPLRSQLKPDGRRYPATSLTDIEQAKNFVRRTAVGAHHFTGTCSMMPRELGGVVDEKLRVHGIRGLRVADASVVPITVRANPQATVYAIAERAADLVKSSL
ncbi:putative GMC-type oxidoreductase Mb1310-like protein 2 [Colletotrichum chlorophyti]|uniref:Putative GMC-type oxidoreductase Mb1310-like protein 2 n=1 Tax=Colletotrichum chlorophyti TaxID=708187 RepID=A0A1Q8RLV3_9PEZI|nr:putative GMC-type oxidoreductase Mb1310-like protein 2 [Colletotrichum chlorophyti]